MTTGHSEQLTDIIRYLDPSASVASFYRLGSLKKDKSPRLLKVEFPSSSVQRSIIREAKNLRNNSKYDGIYIRRSMSREERQQLADLRKQRDNLNRTEPASSTTRYAVYGDKIARFINCKRSSENVLHGGQLDKNYKPDSSNSQ